MNFCDCIKQLDMSNGITSTEIDKYPCLRDIKDLPTTNADPFEISTHPLVPTSKSIAILYKAIQELKAEVEALKAK